jgi:hypothetical protein
MLRFEMRENPGGMRIVTVLRFAAANKPSISTRDD